MPFVTGATARARRFTSGMDQSAGGAPVRSMSASSVNSCPRGEDARQTSAMRRDGFGAERGAKHAGIGAQLGLSARRQCLAAQAVPVFEQQQAIGHKRVRRHGGRRAVQLALREGDVERIVEQFGGGDVSARPRQREQHCIERAARECVAQGRAHLLAQVELEFGIRRTHPGQHAR